MKGVRNMSDKKISLNSNELDNIIGGYIEDDIGRDTYGKEVKCPNCNEASKSMIEYIGPGDIMGNYRCKYCGRYFTVS